MGKAPRRPDETRLLELVGSIYDAILDPSGWDALVRGLVRAVGAERGLLAPGPSAGGAPELLGAAAVDVDAFRPYYEHYVHVDPLMPAGTRFAPEQAFAAEDLLERSGMDWGDMRRTEVYADFLRPRRMVGMLGGHLPLGGETFAALGLYRRSEAPWETPERELLAQVLPHLHRALQLAFRLDVLRDGLAASRAIVDDLGCGVILVDDRGRIVERNRAAAELAAADDGLRLTRNGVSASEARQARRLRALVLDAARAGSGRRGSAGGALALERPSGRRPLQVVVSPLPEQRTAERWGTGASALVLVSDPEAAPPRREELLRAVWGLTPAEARVAKRLADGNDLAAVGEALRIRRETVRNHLKQIYQKTGTHRQAELVRLLHTLPPAPGR